MTKKTKLMVIIGGAAVAVLALGLGLGLGLKSTDYYQLAKDACSDSIQAGTSLTSLSCVSALGELAKEESQEKVTELTTELQKELADYTASKA